MGLLSLNSGPGHRGYVSAPVRRAPRAKREADNMPKSNKYKAKEFGGVDKLFKNENVDIETLFVYRGNTTNINAKSRDVVIVVGRGELYVDNGGERKEKLSVGQHFIFLKGTAAEVSSGELGCNFVKISC